MRAVAIIAFVAWPIATSSGASSKLQRREPACEIIDYGRYKAESQRVSHPDPGSVTGERFEIDSVRFFKQTKQIPATLGQRFGIRYRLRQLPPRATTITWRVTYPAPVRGSKGWEHSFRETPGNGELVQHLLYDFVFASEVVTGTWDFAVLVDGRRACSFSFQVD